MISFSGDDLIETFLIINGFVAVDATSSLHSDCIAICEVSRSPHQAASAQKYQSTIVQATIAIAGTSTLHSPIAFLFQDASWPDAAERLSRLGIRLSNLSSHARYQLSITILISHKPIILLLCLK